MQEKNSLKKIVTNSVLLWIVFSVLLTFLVEVISKGSFSDIYGQQSNKLWCFIYNTSIVMMTTITMFLFKRRIFVFSFISMIWIILSTASNILLKIRGTPLTSSDLKMFKSGLSIMNRYISIKEVVLIMIIAIILIISLISIYKKSYKLTKIRYINSVTWIVIYFVVFTMFSYKITTLGIVKEFFWNTDEAYILYGFPHSFTKTVINFGLSKPYGYSKDSIESILSLINIQEDYKVDSIKSTEATVENPNIIFVQLESLFDPTLIKEISFDKDPIPNLRALSEKYTSGALTVPSLGGGTANTEFEILTGLSMQFFGAGEFPYTTILRSIPIESIAYYLKEKNYTTSAVHNYDGTFYGRYKVFSNLGFDRFISREQMNISEFTTSGWAKDKILVSEIVDLLNTTSEKDFIFAVSVQGHGPYYTSDYINDLKIKIESEKYDEEKIKILQCYSHQIYEMDEFVGKLVEAIEDINEPSVVVFYGDHLPGLNLSDEDVKSGTLYDTQYVIWDNIGLEKESKDLKSYELNAYLLERLKIKGGIISSIKQVNNFNDSYLDKLHLIQYDVLEGKQYAYSENKTYLPTDIEYKFRNIEITSIENKNDELIIKGSNFTVWSKVFVNGKEMETEFVSEDVLKIAGNCAVSGDNIIVSQVCEDKTILGSSKEYTY